MKNLTVGQFKMHFSEVLDMIRNGEEVVLSYGRKKQSLAILLPFTMYRGNTKRTLGILKHKASFTPKSFGLSEEEFLNT